MKISSLLVPLSLCFLGLAACGDKDSKDNKEPAAKTPEGEQSTDGPATPAAGASDKSTGFDVYADQVLAALAKKDKQAFYELALHNSDIKSQFDAMLKECPDDTKKMLGDKTVDDLVKVMSAKLGTDDERVKLYAGYLDDCLKVADFSTAKRTSATPKDVRLRCGGGRADSVLIEAEIAGKPIFITVDDPVKTAAGWRAPESILCSATRP